MSPSKTRIFVLAALCLGAPAAAPVAHAGMVWTPTVNLDGYALLYTGSNTRQGGIGAKASLATTYLERWRLRGSAILESVGFKDGSGILQHGFSLGAGVNFFSDSPAGVWALDGDLFKIDNNDATGQSGNLSVAALRLSFSDRGGRGAVGIGAVRSHYGDLGIDVTQGDLGGRLYFDHGTYLALGLRSIAPGPASPTLAYMGEVGWTTDSGTLSAWGRGGTQQFAVDADQGWIVNLADRQQKGGGLQWRGHFDRWSSWKIGAFWEQLSPTTGGVYNSVGGSASLFYAW